MPDTQIAWTYDLWKSGFRTLFSKIGTKPTVVLISTAFVDIIEKTNVLEKQLGWKVVWCTRNVNGYMYSSTSDRHIADFRTIMHAINMRPSKNNVIFLTCHAACSFSSIINIIRACPGVKVVPYVYDWMHLFCPKENIELWSQYRENGREVAEIEYSVIEKVISGDWVDGVLHKDGSDDMPMLKDCTAGAGHKWIPASLPEWLHQPLPKPNVPPRCCYIGTVVSPESHKREAGLFDDIFMEDIFDDFTKASDCKVDAFSLGVAPDVHKAYRTRFPDGRVKLHNGMMLGKLLPVLKQRFRFGWMLYYWTQPMIMPHVAITIPTKFYTYLALGVPVLVSEELKSVAQLVKKYDCGIVFSQEDLKDPKKKLAERDYTSLQQGVLRARKEMALDVYKPQFAEFMQSVMNLPMSQTAAFRQHQKKQEELRVRGKETA